MSIGRALVLSSALLVSSSLPALPVLAATHSVPARPAVKLALSGDLLAVSDGKTLATPVEKAVLKKGDLVRYTIVALNAGGRPAVALRTIGPVPARTLYVAGSASHSAGSLEFSLDGKNFSATPMVVVNTDHGPVSKPASPDRYVAVRWTAHGALAPKRSFRYTYEVRVQ